MAGDILQDKNTVIKGFFSLFFRRRSPAVGVLLYLVGKGNIL